MMKERIEQPLVEPNPCMVCGKDVKGNAAACPGKCTDELFLNSEPIPDLGAEELNCEEYIYVYAHYSNSKGKDIFVCEACKEAEVVEYHVNEILHEEDKYHFVGLTDRPEDGCNCCKDSSKNISIPF